MKSLVLAELPKVTESWAVSSSRIPHGIYCSVLPKSWSLALYSPRVCPAARERPKLDRGFTVHAQPFDPWSVLARVVFFLRLAKMASVSGIFFCGLALMTLRKR